jgi:nitric oxide reductase activation protein
MTAPLPKDPAPETDEADRTAEPALNPEIQHRLGALLRGMYEDLLDRPVPDRFLEIIRRLDGSPEDGRS